MAKTREQMIQDAVQNEIGRLTVQLVATALDLEAAREEIAALKAQLAAPQPPVSH